MEVDALWCNEEANQRHNEFALIDATTLILLQPFVMTLP